MGSASIYGPEFDALAYLWAAFEREHDQVHPDRGECGGIGACELMAHAHDLMSNMEDALTAWRRGDR